MTEKEGQSAGFQKTSPLLVFLLTTLSGGIYLPIWFLRRRQAFNNLDSRRNCQKTSCVIHSRALPLSS